MKLVTGFNSFIIATTLFSTSALSIDTNSMDKKIGEKINARINSRIEALMEMNERRNLDSLFNNFIEENRIERRARISDNALFYISRYMDCNYQNNDNCLVNFFYE